MDLLCNQQSRGLTHELIRVLFCIFSSLSYGSQGGAIYISSSTTTFNIDSSLFCAISSSAEGGAIYFNGKSSYITRSCGFECTSAAWGNFFYFLHSKSSLQDFDHLSFSYCSKSVLANNFGSMYSRYGNYSMKNLNSTKNMCKNYYSGFALWDFASLDGKYILVSQCYSSDSIVVHLHTLVEGMMSKSIIANNTMVTSNYGIVECAWGTIGYSMILKECAFYGNNGQYLFSRYDNKGNYIITDCVIQHSGDLTKSSPILLTNNLNYLDKEYTFQYENLYTGNYECYLNQGTYTSIMSSIPKIKKAIIFYYYVSII